MDKRSRYQDRGSDAKRPHHHPAASFTTAASLLRHRMSQPAALIVPEDTDRRFSAEGLAVTQPKHCMPLRRNQVKQSDQPDLDPRPELNLNGADADLFEVINHKTSQPLVLTPQVRAERRKRRQELVRQRFRTLNHNGVSHTAAGDVVLHRQQVPTERLPGQVARGLLRLLGLRTKGVTAGFGPDDELDQVDFQSLAGGDIAYHNDAYRPIGQHSSSTEKTMQSEAQTDVCTIPDSKRTKDREAEERNKTSRYWYVRDPVLDKKTGVLDRAWPLDLPTVPAFSKYLQFLCDKIRQGETTHDGQGHEVLAWQLDELNQIRDATQIPDRLFTAGLSLLWQQPDVQKGTSYADLTSDNRPGHLDYTCFLLRRLVPAETGVQEGTAFNLCLILYKVTDPDLTDAVHAGQSLVKTMTRQLRGLLAVAAARNGLQVDPDDIHMSGSVLVFPPCYRPSPDYEKSHRHLMAWMAIEALRCWGTGLPIVRDAGDLTRGRRSGCAELLFEYKTWETQADSAPEGLPVRTGIWPTDTISVMRPDGSLMKPQAIRDQLTQFLGRDEWTDHRQFLYPEDRIAVQPEVPPPPTTADFLLQRNKLLAQLPQFDVAALMATVTPTTTSPKPVLTPHVSCRSTTAALTPSSPVNYVDDVVTKPVASGSASSESPIGRTATRSRPYPTAVNRPIRTLDDALAYNKANPLRGRTGRQEQGRDELDTRRECRAARQPEEVFPSSQEASSQPIRA